MASTIDHDRLFKELLRTFFIQFLELFFPDVAAYVDPASIEFLDKEVFTDVTRGERYEADLIAKVAFRGQDTSFLIHTEAQGKRQEHFPSRMFGYFARFHERYRLPIYPIVIFSYTSPLRAEPKKYSLKFPDLEVLKFQYRTVQLNRLHRRDFLRSSNPVASALMARMYIKEKDRPRVKMECLRLLATLGLNPAKQQLISGFVDAYLRLNQPELLVFEAEIAKLHPEEEKAVLKITTSWKEEGILEGQIAGKVEGLRQATLKILEKRFGSVPEDLVLIVQTTKDPGKLESLNLGAAVEPSLDSLRATLAKRPLERGNRRAENDHELERGRNH